MHINTDEIEEERINIEDFVVPYSSIEITHANDNKPPFKVVFGRFVVWALIVAMAVGLCKIL